MSRILDYLYFICIRRNPIKLWIASGAPLISHISQESLYGAEKICFSISLKLFNKNIPENPIGTSMHEIHLQCCEIRNCTKSCWLLEPRKFIDFPLKSHQEIRSNCYERSNTAVNGGGVYYLALVLNSITIAYIAHGLYRFLQLYISGGLQWLVFY